jgi:hypothetical protein
MSKYAGQKVRYVGSDSGSFTYGKIYDVVPSRAGDNWVSVRVDDNGRENGVPYYCFELVPAAASDTFKAGDKVRYTGHHTFNFTKGKVYDVGGFYHDDQPGWVGIVADDTGKNNGWAAKYFELVTEPVPAKPKYKVGDKVRFIAGALGSFTKGKIYEVGGEFYDPSYENSVGIKLDDRGRANAWMAEYFELVEPATAVTPADIPHIVAVKQAAGIAPAFRPVVHGNAALATREAKRLAEANPGNEFAIYARVAAFRAERPVAAEVA